MDFLYTKSPRDFGLFFFQVLSQTTSYLGVLREVQLSFCSFPREDGLVILSFRTSAEGINRSLETLGRTRGGLFGATGGLGVLFFVVVIINF